MKGTFLRKPVVKTVSNLVEGETFSTISLADTPGGPVIRLHHPKTYDVVTEFLVRDAVVESLKGSGKVTHREPHRPPDSEDPLMHINYYQLIYDITHDDKVAFSRRAPLRKKIDRAILKQCPKASLPRHHTSASSKTGRGRALGS